MVPLTVAPAAGAVRDTVGAVVSLLTVTVTAADVVELPAASRATAASVWVPLVPVVVVQETAYGAVVASPPRVAPSSLNCTPTTPTLSVALAVTEVGPLTVAPPAGAASETVGRVVSFPTITVTGAGGGEMPPASPTTSGR